MIRFVLYTILSIAAGEPPKYSAKVFFLIISFTFQMLCKFFSENSKFLRGFCGDNSMINQGAKWWQDLVTTSITLDELGEVSYELSNVIETF